jgi:DNA polymerase III alpha subunit
MTVTVDPWGRTVLDMDDLPELLYTGLKVEDVYFADDSESERFNRLCRQWDRPQHAVRVPEPVAHSPEEEHATRASQWLVCDELRGLDVRAFLISACSTDAQRARVNQEMDLYEDRGLVPLLQTMICLVEHFRANKVVWGVGRGSSVASYVLYMIGVHRIDSILYDLKIEEFLK